ncbi:unnamed protein product [Rotaria sordida]|uniref:Uncharacterized protein n=1 Tax=Rotaria sordida TaxID=392033 RepID=A0A813X9C0_9BILA|nr:unnamed protein product [Rotaria sordida]
MERDEDDDIPTPNTSRSNSINEDEEKPSSSPLPPPDEETIQSESSPTKDTSNNIAEQIRTTLAAKRASFASSSSSVSASSESDTDFVDVTKNDVTQDGSTSMNVVSFANWLMRSNDCFV